MPSPILSASNSAVGQVLRPRVSRIIGALVAAAPPAEGLLTTLLTGLECYWKLNEATGATRVDSHGVEDLSDNGGMVQAAGKLTSSCVSAAGKWLTRASTRNIQLGNQDLTFSVWAYPTSEEGNAVIFSKGSVADIPAIEMSVTYDADRHGAFELWQASSLQRLSGDVLTKDAWNHIVAWQDVANNLIGIQVNGGTPVTAARTKTPLAGGTALSIGAYADNQYNFPGRICELGIWKRVLTADERAALYNAGAGLAYPFLGGAALFSTVNANDAGGQNIQLLIPGNIGVGKAYPIVIYHHGQSETQTAISVDALKQGVVRNLLGNGYIVCGSNQHGGVNGDNWGNSQALSDILALYNYAAAHYSLAWRTIHFSQSAGGPSGLLCSVPGLVSIPYVKGWMGVYPAANLSYLYAHGWNAEIDGAYNIPGGGTYAAQTAGHDAALLAASKFDGLRMRFYASAADATITKVDNTDAMRTLVTGHAAELALVTCTGGHGDPSHFMPVDAAAFCARCV